MRMVSEMIREIMETLTGKGGAGAGGRNTIRIPTGQSYNPETYKPAREMKKGGKVKVSSASKRADGCAIKGKTKGRFV